MSPTDTPITSTANPLIKKLRAHENRKARDESGLFVVEGLRHVAEALAAGWQADLLLTTPKLRADATLRRAHKGARYEATPELLGRALGRNNGPEAVGLFHQRWVAPAALAEGLWIGLEEIRDPGNLGTIIRTAEAAGAAGVLLIGACCDPFAQESIRASVGAFSRVPLLKLSRETFLAWRASYQGQIIGTTMNTPHDFRAVEYTRPLLLLMGSEHAGLTDKLIAACTKLVKIPMQGQIESLNVATASALMLYQAGLNTNARR